MWSGECRCLVWSGYVQPPISTLTTSALAHGALGLSMRDLPTAVRGMAER
jgi:hypothetical protein